MAEHTEDGADAEQETAADAHRDDVAYLVEQIDLTAADLTGWSVETLSDGRYAVSGRCPVCRGDDYGPALNRADAPDGEVSERAARPVQRMVPTSCRCGRGHGHGKDGAERLRAVLLRPGPAMTSAGAQIGAPQPVSHRGAASVGVCVDIGGAVIELGEVTVDAPTEVTLVACP